MAFDPNTKKADEVLAYLDTADSSERSRVLEAEKVGKGRKSVLEPHGVDPDGPDVRRSGTGRILGAQEADPQVAAGANLGKQLAEQKEVLADSDAAPDEQAVGGSGGVTPAGTGDAPAAGAGSTGATTGGLGV